MGVIRRPRTESSAAPSGGSLRHAWSLRLLLAALLLAGSEVLLWTNPLGREPFAWVVLVAGYSALSTLLLEIAARFRMHNIFSLIALAGIYGLGNGLLLNPETALVEVPRTLISRALGAHALIGLLVLALYLRLAGGLRLPTALTVIVGAVIGLAWGFWARWSPTELLLTPGPPTEPSAILIAGGISLIVIIALLLLVGRLRRAHADDALPFLTRVEWLGVATVLITLLIVRLLNATLDSLSLTVGIVLSGYSLIILWFLRRVRGATLLD
ncbi:MAG: hypothetical protein GYB67_11365, partial [Chloroflexi bacterium]|nr:hypothetical protein [Chloroflexota bacterium]